MIKARHDNNLLMFDVFEWRMLTHMYTALRWKGGEFNMMLLTQSMTIFIFDYFSYNFFYAN